MFIVVSSAVVSSNGVATGTSLTGLIVMVAVAGGEFSVPSLAT
jgi:hypothetical protein